MKFFFPFKGFKTPLMKHIVMLYFLTPEYSNWLSKKKEGKVIESKIVVNNDGTRTKTTRYEKKETVGRKKRVFSQFEKEFIKKAFP